MIKVLGILGTSYCGSTICGLMLNTHPEIATIGEVRHAFDGVLQDTNKRLSEPERRGAHGTNQVGCYLDKEKCNIFRVNEFPYKPEGFYDKIAERLNTKILVDSSKTLTHFRKFDEKTIDLMYLVMIKDPLGFLNSVIKYKQNSDINWVGNIYVKIYEQILRVIPDYKHIILPYERFIKRRKKNFIEIAKLLGVENKFDINNFQKYECHHIMGNINAFKSTKIKFSSEKNRVKIDPQVLKKMWDIYKRVNRRKIGRVVYGTNLES